MIELQQYETCIFKTNKNGKQCNALKDPLCYFRDCPFYKSREEYELSSMGFATKKKEKKDDKRRNR